MTPVELKRTEDGLQIVWSDGQTWEYTARELRDACPCATCREKNSAVLPPGTLPLLSPEEMQPLVIDSMQPTGAYAYAIGFSDGHHSGLYGFELLRELGKVIE